MNLTRREFLTLAGALAVATRVPFSTAARALGSATPAELAALAAAAAELTTLGQTLGAGPAGPRGYRPVVSRAGEPHLVRADLAAPVAGRETRRTSLVSFVHLTDQHIVDVQSTSRVEFLDRYTDGTRCSSIPFGSAHRPHEAASVRITDAMLQRVRRIGVSPVTGLPLQAAICTGDNTDNQQSNELDLFIGVMDGGLVEPDSGARGTYEGVQKSGDVHYWHPDPAVADLYKTTYGFPSRPGFLETALASFEAVGSGVPWYTCFGNHDGMAQGTVPSNPAFERIGVGSVKAVGLPPGTDPCTPLAGLGTPGAPVMVVTPDAERRYSSRREWVEKHLASPGAPSGHGLTAANLADDTLYYATDVGGVRFVVLDTVNPGGHSDGSIGDRQLRWLGTQLTAADAAQRPVLLFSHHGPRSLDNVFDNPDPSDPAGGDGPRHKADAVLSLIAQHACVIGWVNGHSHLNVITPRDTFWDVGTAAHIDWPPQCRLVDVVDNHDGTLSIFTTMVDHEDGDVVSVARELCGNDPQHGFADGTGGVDDRNTELVVAHPFPG